MNVSFRCDPEIYFVDEREVSSIAFFIKTEYKYFGGRGLPPPNIETHHLVVSWKAKTGEETVLSWKLTSSIDKKFLDDALDGKIGSEEALCGELSSRTLENDCGQIIDNLRAFRTILESKKLPVVVGVLD